MPEVVIAPAFFLILLAAMWLIYGRHQDAAKRRQLLKNGTTSFLAFVVTLIVATALVQALL